MAFLHEKEAGLSWGQGQIINVGPLHISKCSTHILRILLIYGIWRENFEIEFESNFSIIYRSI